jgi:transposase-like protein
MDAFPYFFCPRKGCPNHRLDAGRSDHWYYRIGTHETQAFGSVQRYRCRSCRKTFSDQTFSLNYYLKKKTDFRAFAKQLNSRSSDLFCARHFGYSTASMQTRVDRLARNGIYLHSRVGERISLSEHLVADGLESYTASKFFPTTITVLIGKASEYVYAYTLSHSRRKGRMSEQQREQAKGLYADISFTPHELTIRFSQLTNPLQQL